MFGPNLVIYKPWTEPIFRSMKIMRYFLWIIWAPIPRHIKKMKSYVASSQVCNYFLSIIDNTAKKNRPKRKYRLLVRFVGHIKTITAFFTFGLFSPSFEIPRIGRSHSSPVNFESAVWQPWQRLGKWWWRFCPPFDGFLGIQWHENGFELLAVI